SGNSPNILRALECAREMRLRSYAVLGYSGGKAKQLADVPIHFAGDDVQISEGMQVVVGHMLMQWLYKRNATARLAKASESAVFRRAFAFSIPMSLHVLLRAAKDLIAACRQHEILR